MAMCGTVCIFVVSICFKFTEYFVYGNGSRFPLGIMPSLLRHNTVAPRFQVGLLSGVMFVTVMMIPTIITDVNNQWCWGISSIGRARALQARGTEIETRILHTIGTCLLLVIFFSCLLWNNFATFFQRSFKSAAAYICTKFILNL